MTFSSELAEIRFGFGLSPVVQPPTGIDAMLAGVRAPDAMAAQFPIDTFEQFASRISEAVGVLQSRRKSKDEVEREELRKLFRRLNGEAAKMRGVWAGQTLLRRAQTPAGFRERLVAFWADHFSAVGKTGLLRFANSSFVESVIRPHVSGRFSDMLFAATTHPVMMDYLDQVLSVGPNSAVIGENKRLKGLNENLAREVMELHTLGVDGPYTQNDVRQLAELFTGLSYFPRRGFFFRKEFSEPGAETVLGKTYSAEARLETIRDVLDDLARHPATAKHIAGKLAKHFLSDDPDPALVAHIEARFIASGGDLDQVYAALLEHPAAWREPLRNVKPPLDFIASAFRALNLQPEPIQSLKYPRMRATLFQPLTLMGQPWRTPSGPDGWPEEDAAWITPQNIAVRLRWAMGAPQVFRPDLPDPRDFVTHALGSRAPKAVHFAASAAESRAEAIGLVLCAPAFQRR